MLEPERRRISQEVAAILETGDAHAMEAAPAEQEFVDLKEIFCKHWQIVKDVLQFLSQFFPQKWKDRIAAIIKAGDFIFGQVCG